MAKLIQGHIRTESGSHMPEICVSNGRETVQTDTHGDYQLSCRSEDRFVFMTVPAGYLAVGKFYIDLKNAGNFDFTLRHHPEGENTSFSFVQITDTHISVDRRAFASHLEDDLARIHRDVGGLVQFIVASGDLTAGGGREEYRAYLRAVTTSTLPVYHAAGNHDDDAEIEGVNFMDFLGPLYYSFDYGPVHFIVYDGEGHLRRDGAHQNRWMRANLDIQPSNKPVIIINHFPWGSGFYDQWKAYPIIATLSGHWHSCRIFLDGRTVHFNTPSLGFGGIDQSPRAYRLFTYKGGKLESESRALVSPRIFSGISFRPHPDNVLGVVQGFEGVHPEPGADWHLFHGNPRRTGSAAMGPEPPLTPAWRAGTGGSIHMAAPLVAEGSIFQSTKNEDDLFGNGLVALDARAGTLCWCHSTDSAIKGTPAYCNGRLFAVTVTGHVLGLAAESGKLLWSYQLGDPSQRWVYSSPLTGEGRVYIGVSSHFVALNQESGDVVWIRDDFGQNDFLPSYASPAAFGKYIVVAFYTQRTNLTVLEAETGRTVWTKTEGKPYQMYSTPVIDENGTIYTVSGGAMRAFNLVTGELAWEIPFAPNRVHATPALAKGNLFAGTGGGMLHALETKSGAEVWRWVAGGDGALFTPYVRQGAVTLTSPTVAGDCVYVGAANGYLYALDTATGTCVWQYNLEIPLAAPPAISGNGLWVGGCDGYIYGFSAS